MTPLRTIAPFLFLSGVVAAAYADAVRPKAATALSLQLSAPYPVLRGDNQRTGHVTKFPSELKKLWKFNTQNNLEFPAVSVSGFVDLALSSGHLVRLDAVTGKERQRISLPAPPIQGPVVTSRGDRVLITKNSECIGYTPAGDLRFRRSLPAPPSQLLVAPLAPASGGVLLAAGSTLLQLDGEGRLLDQASLPELPVGMLVETPQGVLATTASGRVYRWRSPDFPVRVGSLGGELSSTPAWTGNALVAVVDDTRLVFFDLVAGVPRTSILSPAAFAGSPTVGYNGDTWMITSAGVLLALDAKGSELERFAILGGGSDLDASGNSLLIAPGGKLAFFRPSAELVIWSKQGEFQSEQPACVGPIGLLSDGDRLIVSCQDGIIAAYGNAI